MPNFKSLIKHVPHSRGYALEFMHRFLSEHDVKDKTVIDVSAGSGFVANLWHNAGASVQSFDMYPDVFKSEAISCSFIDLNQPLNIASATADYVLLMETIEHIPNQTFLLQELSRILKPDGTLIITKPNNSGLSGRLGNLWVEAERGNMFLSNEASVIGYDDTHIYNGRVYLCTAQRLRTLAGLAGLKLKEIHPNKLSGSSLVWFVIFGVFLKIRSFLTLKRMLRKTQNEVEKQILKEQHALNTNLTLLLHKHLCVSFQKR
ncbi:Methyltransferase type 11 [Emticicia oligotrophica DSM 17448]|uniref:Methyltransferase type 11 n=1 Tax=Emticicia oligotrophica (strain DSM 17448 / CIP 109782 / MTCC 6937 / GPTSA100-15) TaxID=929562 RepID=A0ABM5N1D6_EMTOG|nr:methyltransferase domain-containing protein [Emticicia oligotrophica]AFK03239.1 Methyltransferase type 11 [Emticicia oligotrophica DSM 17448]